ncbi:ABC transporter substrate-binding protein [Salinisphaera hydrothermalis]|uniref:D-ribose-binding periplasmic protein n=1 Tax=Salinisphaera hydrothermalis (strain C41B8) TaxID=1304275 RepID=A0A084IPY8_SALHC|nr:ABC transporter substrate-binding protein [Salinisphaera hydrothermalis]KEZ78772.1 D-ribose-binding periplasmic protein precursor [Salinisphaera hydrothermalis C41B8]
MGFSSTRGSLLAAVLVGSLAATTAGAAWAADNGAADNAATCTNKSPSKMPFSKMTVGFSQSENLQNPFRAAETKSVRDAAKAAGVKRLLYANANSDQAKQVSDIQSMINQGANALIVAPLNSTGLKPALEAAAAKGIPVVTIDRQTAGKPCRDFITFMGSDFHKQAVRAAKQLVKATGGKAKIVELQGAYGNSVETARTDGFAQIIDQHKGMQIVAKQSAKWSTTEAQKVMSQILLSHPDVNAVYAQSDTMALGAIKAIQQFGKTPGKDIQVVSIDGTTEAVKLVANGQIAADIETNPRFGKRAFQAIHDYMNGQPVKQTIIMHDHLFTPANAQKSLDSGKVY